MAAVILNPNNTLLTIVDPFLELGDSINAF